MGTAEVVGDGIELYYSDGYAGTNSIGTPGESLIEIYASGGADQWPLQLRRARR